MIQNQQNNLISQALTSGRLEPAKIKKIFDLIETEGLAGKNLLEVYLMTLNKRGVADSEVDAMAKLLLSRARKISIPSFFIDVCGTGGDKSNSFNISTAVAFLLSASGIPVLKHGNRSVSSKCGSSDLMEGLGVSLDRASRLAKRTLSHLNFGYLHAPLFHPFLAQIAPIRKRIGEPTVLNYLGPLLHPASPKIQLVGISEPKAFSCYAFWLREVGRKQAFVVRGEEGLDEASPYGKTELYILDKGKVRKENIRARDFGFKARGPRELSVKNTQESLSIFRKILSGSERGPQAEAVLLNAGLGFLLVKKAKNLREGIAKAREVMASKKGLELLKNYQAETQ